MLFESIYDNYQGYRLAVIGVIGHDGYIFADDIVSDCIAKLAGMIHNGDIEVADVCYMDTNKINHSYFNRMVRRRALDMVKSKKSGHMSEEYYPAIEDEGSMPLFIDSVDELNYIEEELELYEMLSTDNKFNADIFRYIYFQGIPAAKLSRDVDVPRYTIQETKHFMKGVVIGWLTEAREKRLIMKVRSIIGVNEVGEQVIFSSFAEAKREGYPNVSKAMKGGKEVKGYTFSYIDEEPSGVREMEEALAEPSEGAGDTINKVLNSPLVAPLTNIVKQIFGDDDCGCNERREALNKLLPYQSKATKCYTEKMYGEFKPLQHLRGVIPHKIGQVIAKHHAYIFNHKVVVPCSTCGGGRKIKQWHRELLIVFNSYEGEV